MNAESASISPRSAALSVVLADDHNLVREGLKLMVGDIFPQASFREAGDADELFAQARRAPPADLALIDLNMPGMEKGARLHELHRAFPRLPLVVVSALTSPDVIRRSLEIPSVFAFVAKSSPPGTMRAAIDAALAGTRLAYALPDDRPVAAEIALPPRLNEVHRLLRQGMSNKRIAVTLGISEGTVKNYVTDIFKALQVSNRTQAAQIDPDLT